MLYSSFPILFVAFIMVLRSNNNKFQMGKWPANICRNDFLKSKLNETDFSCCLNVLNITRHFIKDYLYPVPKNSKSEQNLDRTVKIVKKAWIAILKTFFKDNFKYDHMLDYNWGQ